MSIVLNLFGAPSSGKSTAAAYIFSMLKMHGIKCEYISEYAKDKCWEQNKFIFEKPENQFYIGAKQFYAINKVIDKVDIIITDSPILMNKFYNHSELLGEDYNKVLLRLFNSFENINYFLVRTHTYENIGRNQSQEQSNKIAEQMKKQLKIDLNDDIQIVNNTKQNYDKIIAIILALFKGK